MKGAAPRCGESLKLCYGLFIKLDEKADAEAELSLSSEAKTYFAARLDLKNRTL